MSADARTPRRGGPPGAGPTDGWIDRNYRWLVVAASLVLLIHGQGALFVLTVSLKDICATFDWPREIPSAAYALASFCAGLGSIYVAQLSERIGMGPVAVFGAAMLAAGIVAGSFVEAPWQLYAAFGLLVGLLGNACMFSPIMANTTRWFDRQRGLAIGIVGCGQSLAGVIWPQAVRWVNAHEGWRTSFLWFGIWCAVATIPTAFVLRRRPPAPPPAARLGTAHDALVMGWPSVAVMGLVCSAIVGCCIAMAMPITHLFAYGTDLGHSAASAADLLSVMLVCSMVGRIGGGLVADRIGGFEAVMIGSAIQAGMLAALAYTESLGGLFLVAGLFGVGYGGIIPIYAVGIRQYFPLAGAARRIAVVYFFGLCAMAAGSWLGGWIFDMTGSYRPAFLVGVAANMVNLVLLSILILRGRRSRRMVPLALRGVTP